MWPVALGPQPDPGASGRDACGEKLVGVGDVRGKGEWNCHSDPGHFEVHEQPVLPPEDVAEVTTVAIALLHVAPLSGERR